MPTSFPLVIASSAFSLVALIGVVLAISIPSWYVVQTDSTTTSFGAFQICVEDRNGGGTDCYRIDSQAFVAVGDSSPLATPCRRSAGEMSSRFGAIFGILIVAAVFCIVSACLLLYVILKTFQRRNKFNARAAKHRARISDPHYQPGDNSDDSSDDEDANVTSAGMIGEQNTMPLPEIISMIVMVIVVILTVVSWATYLSNMRSWLYCDNSPCDYLGQNDEVTKCDASVDYVFAIAIIAWLAAIVATVLLVVRWIVLRVCPYSTANRRPPRERQMRRVDEHGNPIPPTVANNTNTNRAPAAGVVVVPAARPAAGGGVRLNSSGVPVQPGEPPGVDLPEGQWEWDNNAGLFWSEEQQYFYDIDSAEFYCPESELWYNPETDQWHTI